MSKFPHCSHSTIATIPFPEGVSADGFLEEVRGAYSSLDSYALYERKRENPGCCPHSLETDATLVGGWTSPGCGWIDYQFWHFPSSPNPGYGAISDRRAVVVFSRSSNFLCGFCPHFIRALCGMCCQCYGDGGKNQIHIAELMAEADKQKQMGPISFI
ncbi:MAG: hypothetical protein Q8P67_24325 [archaeon]|nr:hypothetical protein [archaeon]